MLFWLIGVAVCVLIWGWMWRSNPWMSFGVLIGLLIAWLVSHLLTPYVTGMDEIPVWLPALPLATVAIVLLVYGALVWIRGNDGLPQPKEDDHDHHGY
jgi:hypothetical protein